jgi:DNA-binding transcriptional regulator YdaS (Cro superfamily)
MVVRDTPSNALLRALRAAGGQSALARICGVTQAAVWKWLNRGVRVPAECVLSIEAATGVSRHDLRPDIYPREDLSSDATASRRLNAGVR